MSSEAPQLPLLRDGDLAVVAAPFVNHHGGNLDIAIEKRFLFEMKFAATDYISRDLAVNDGVDTFHIMGKSDLSAFFDNQALAANLADDFTMAAQHEVARAISTTFQSALEVEIVAAYGNIRDNGFLLNGDITSGLNAPVPVLTDDVVLE